MNKAISMKSQKEGNGDIHTVYALSGKKMVYIRNASSEKMKGLNAYVEDCGVVMDASLRLWRGLVDSQILHLRRPEDDVCVWIWYGCDVLGRGSKRDS